MCERSAIAQVDKAMRGDGQACQLGQVEGDALPPHSVPLVVLMRELGDHEAAVITHRCLGRAPPSEPEPASSNNLTAVQSSEPSANE